MQLEKLWASPGVQSGTLWNGTGRMPMAEILVYILLGVVVASVGGLGYYMLQLRRKSLAEEEETFRHALIHQLRTVKTHEFVLDSFARTCGVSTTIAHRAAEDVFRSAARKAVVRTGVINKAGGHIFAHPRVLLAD